MGLLLLLPSIREATQALEEINDERKIIRQEVVIGWW